MIKVEYNASMRDRILELMRQGALKVEVAAELGISMDKLRLWRMTYPELDEILTLGETFSMAWWSRQGRCNLENAKFNFPLWYSIMRNAYGYGDKPSERNLALDEWGGNFKDKIQTLDNKIQKGDIAPEGYSHMMKSLSYHAAINEIIYVQPAIAKLELEKEYKDGEIDESVYQVRKFYLDKLDEVRQIAADQIFKTEKLRSQFNMKQQRKSKQNVRERKERRAEELEATEAIRVDEPSPFEAKAKQIRNEREKRLGSLDKNDSSKE